MPILPILIVAFIGMVFDFVTNIIGLVSSIGFSVLNGVTLLAIFQCFVAFLIAIIILFFSANTIEIMENSDASFDNSLLKIIVIAIMLLSWLTSFLGICEFLNTGTFRLAGLSLLSINLDDIFKLGFLKICLALIMAIIFTLCTPYFASRMRKNELTASSSENLNLD
ncbi:MAG: hypothetical protein KME49_00295 [Brasilonema octagenarum HA4186-MV1]|jgi:hypothetical protein|nr:hypothetical protein [Brasilonema octagenarum HA4186-MV1]